MKPTKDLLRSQGAEIYILALARSFPCLEHKLRGYVKWDAIAFRKMSRAWSHGERLAADFVLTVWNYYDAKREGCLFDFCDAVSVLDAGNLVPVYEWARDPAWP